MGDRADRDLHPRTQHRRPVVRRKIVRAALRHHGGPAGVENPRHLCAARSPRRQAAVSASLAPHLGLPAAHPRPSLAGRACRLVQGTYPATALTTGAFISKILRGTVVYTATFQT